MHHVILKYLLGSITPGPVSGWQGQNPVWLQTLMAAYFPFHSQAEAHLKRIIKLLANSNGGLTVLQVLPSALARAPSANASSSPVSREQY